MNAQGCIRLSAFAVLIAAVGFGTAQAQQASGSAGAPEVKTLKVMATSDVQIGGPWLVARDKGYFKREGFEQIELLLVPAAAAAFPAYASGQLQIMNHAEQAMLTLVAADVPLKVVAIYSDMTGLHGMVANSSIKVAKDLEGKILGVQKSSPLEWYTMNFCKTYGCDITKVNVVNMSIPESIPALVNGSIHAYAGWQPFIDRALEAGKAKGLHLVHYNNTSRMPGSEGPRRLHSAYAILYVPPSFLEKNPKTVDALLRILAKSITFIKENRTESAKIFAAEYKLSESAAGSYIDGVKFGLSINDAVVKEFQETANVLFREKVIKKQIDFAKTALDTAPLKRVSPNAVTYGR